MIDQKSKEQYIQPEEHDQEEDFYQVNLCKDSKQVLSTTKNLCQNKIKDKLIPLLALVLGFAVLFSIFKNFRYSKSILNYQDDGEIEIELSDDRQLVEPMFNLQESLSISLQNQLKMKQLAEKLQKLTEEDKPSTQIIQENSNIDQQHRKKSKLTQLQILSRTQEKLRSESKKKVKDGFPFPKLLWVYVNDEAGVQNYLSTLIYKQIKQKAKQQGFVLHLLNNKIYRRYLSNSLEAKVERILYDLWKKRLLNSKLESHYWKLKQNMVNLAVLLENGGVVLDKDIVLTQNFDWMKQISSNIYVNRGKSQVPLNYLGFYLKQCSSPKQSLITQGNIKEVVVLPCLDTSLMAAPQGSNFLRLFLDKYIQLVENIQLQKQLTEKFGLSSFMKEIQPYQKAYYLAQRVVLLAKQQQLDSKSKQQGERRLAIDQFGIQAISSYYGPRKLDFILGFNDDRTYRHFAQLPLEQLIQMYGPFRYMTFVTAHDKVSSFLQNAKKLDTNYRVVSSSFIGKYLLNYQGDTPNFITNEDISIKKLPTPKKWSKLNPVVWTYLTNHLKKDKQIIKITIDNIMKIANISGFKFVLLNDQNIQRQITEQKRKNIKQATKNLPGNIKEKILLQLYKLAILSQKGGVWMDPTTIPVQSLDWIVNIAQKPFVWNRFGDLPKVLLSFNPLEGGPFHWEFAQNTRAAWHLGYQANFIASEPCELMSKWFNQMIVNLKLPYFQLQNKFRQCKIQQYQWTRNDGQRNLHLDSLKCLLGMKQQQIDKTQKSTKDYAASAFKLWGINSFTGAVKLQKLSNIEDNRQSYNNPYLWKYSMQYYEGILGKVKYFLRLTSEQLDYSEDILKGKNSNSINPNSFLQIHRNPQNNLVPTSLT